MTLRERLADPHGDDNRIFPKPIAEMSDVEQEEELRECSHAIAINVWQSTAQRKAVQQRADVLTANIRREEEEDVMDLAEVAADRIRQNEEKTQ